MVRPFRENETISGQDFSTGGWVCGEFENCRFVRCGFSSVDLSDALFERCSFEGCDLSMARMKNTVFRDVSFRECKLLGLRFEDCNKFSLSFRFSGSILNFASFYKLKLKEICFDDCKLVETDFTEADLTGASFADCDLSGAVFERTVLERADFRTARQYVIRPETNRIKKAKFSMSGLSGLLQQYDIEISY